MLTHERSQREKLILGLIAERPIGTQQELVAALETRGLEVTQATVSRDIKRLGLVKSPSSQGYRYAAPSGAPRPVGDFVVGLDEAEAILVVRTLSGRAGAVACAIDEAELSEVAASLAGDDTVLVLVRRRDDKSRVRAALEEIL